LQQQPIPHNDKPSLLHIYSLLNIKSILGNAESSKSESIPWNGGIFLDHWTLHLPGLHIQTSVAIYRYKCLECKKMHRMNYIKFLIQVLYSVW